MTIEFDSDLIRQFARGNGTIFVGAGASIPAGLPSWSALINPLKAQIQDCPADVSVEDIAHLFAMEHGSHRLVEHMQRELSGPRFRPTRVHRELVQMPVSRIFTTNFDKLLEQAAWDSRINHHVVVNEADVSFSDTATLQIVKLHGDLGHPDSLVIATPHYESFFRRRPALSDLVKVELQTRTVLFLGYSFNDANLRAILSRIGGESSVFQRNIYSIQLNPKPPVIRALEHRGVKVIEIRTDPDLLDAERRIEEWFTQFSLRLRITERRRRTGVAGTFDEQGDNDPSDDDPLLSGPLAQSIPPQPLGVPRSRLVDRILQCLGSRYPVVVLAGDGGFGKTHLAIKVAWACLYPDRFRERCDIVVDYVAWVPFAERPSEQGHISAVFDAIARATGSFALLREHDSERRRRGIMRLLLGHRCLVVLDNFNGDDPDLNTWLEEVPEPSRILVTTRRPSKVSGLTIEVPGLNDDEAQRLLERRTRRLRLFFGPNREAVFEGIRKATVGNPQAMRLFLGLLKLCGAGQPERRSRADTIVHSFAQRLSVNPSPVSELFAEFWETHFDDDARWLLLAAAVLSDTSSSFRPEMLYATLEPADTLNWARVSQTCLDAGLLERRPAEERYIMRPQIRALVFDKVNSLHSPAEGRSASNDKNSLFGPLLKYVLPLVERVVSRDQPSEEYWNALVTDAMIELDPDILLVMAVAQWAVESSTNASLAVHLVLMLTHYLDSRFRHNERIELVRRAVKLLQVEREAGRAIDSRAVRREALFHIDSLGWTYLDQGAYDAALEEIDSGEQLVLSGNTDADLRLIASAWRAEAYAAKGDGESARRLLVTARQQVGSTEVMELKPWIAMRFEMACGDVDLLANSGNARAHYTKAAAYAGQYGDEGGGYQWRPRLALAHVLNEEADEARSQFAVLAHQTEVELARLHGRYGYALMALNSSEDLNARAEAERIRAEIERRVGESSLLMRLFHRVFERKILK